MSQTVTLIIVGGVIGLAVVLVAGYFIVRHMRGSIKMTLANSSFSAGEQITGSFTLMTKKDIEGQKLVVALVGKEITEERHGDRNRTDTREIYRDEKVLEEARNYPAGFSADYGFQLKAPAPGGSDSIGGAIGDAIELGLDVLGGDRTRIEWNVEARLKAGGIDLATGRQVYINGPGL